MKINRKKAISIIICVLFLFFTFASLLFIVEEENHNCTGEDCPVCASIHMAEQTLKNLGDGSYVIIAINPMPILSVLVVSGLFLLISHASLVSHKVRLND